MTMAEVQEDRVATIKYKRDRVSEDEQEIAELEAERNKDVEAQREEEAEQNLGAEEQTYKKRYGDLRRHTQKIQDENKRQLQKLQDQVEALTKKQVKLPKSDEELEKWTEQYPDVAKIVETIASKKAMEASNDVEEKLRRVEELELRIEREKAETELSRLHPDYDDLRQDKDFHDWVSEQPKWIQSALYENDTDFLGAAKAIDLYKSETGKKAKNKDTGAAKSVRTSKRSEELTEGKNSWSESRVRQLSGADFERFQEDIEKAIRSGNFDYDISGGAR
jgi:DNA repair exonuclease SbcCD ATPase subunit